MKQKILALFIFGCLAFGFAEAKAQSGNQVSVSNMELFLKKEPKYVNDFTHVGAPAGMVICTVPSTLQLLNHVVLAQTGTSKYPAPMKNLTPSTVATPTGTVPAPKSASGQTKSASRSLATKAPEKKQAPATKK